MKKISVVIPTLRKSLALNACVESVCHIAESSQIETEIIVVDNSGLIDDLSFDNLGNHSFSSLKVVTSGRGANAARNKGAHLSQAEVILFIDDDCIIDDDYFFGKHLRFHSENPTTYACGGLYKTNLQSNLIDRFYVSGQNDWVLRGVNVETNQANYLLGGNVSIKKSIFFDKHLSFDESIKYGGSETELFVRVKSLGLLCFLIDAQVVHQCDMTALSLCIKSYKQGRGKKYREVKLSFANANSLYLHKPILKTGSPLLTWLQSLFFKLGYRWGNI